jgi:hypothetical protein
MRGLGSNLTLGATVGFFGLLSGLFYALDFACALLGTVVRGVGG